MIKFNASIPALFLVDVFCVDNGPVVTVAVDMGGLIRDVDGAEDVNIFELFCDRSALSRLGCLISLRDRSPLLSMKICHFKYSKKKKSL